MDIPLTKCSKIDEECFKLLIKEKRQTTSQLNYAFELYNSTKCVCLMFALSK